MAAVVARHPEAGRARLIAERQGESDSMRLQVEVANAGDDLRAALAESLQAVTKLRGSVELLTPGTLPNDGKVIDDRRGTVG